jgi:hypothetical protein
VQHATMSGSSLTESIGAEYLSETMTKETR